MTQPTKTGIEQRKYKRITTDRPIKLTNKNESFNLKMINISQGGAGILSAIFFEDDDIISVDLSLPFIGEVTSLSLNGKVVHSTPVRGQYLVGIKFDQLSSHQKRVIEHFVNHASGAKL